jgi:hypothetical protein
MYQCIYELWLYHSSNFALHYISYVSDFWNIVLKGYWHGHRYEWLSSTQFLQSLDSKHRLSKDSKYILHLCSKQQIKKLSHFHFHLTFPTGRCMTFQGRCKKSQVMCRTISGELPTSPNPAPPPPPPPPNPPPPPPPPPRALWTVDYDASQTSQWHYQVQYIRARFHWHVYLLVCTVNKFPWQVYLGLDKFFACLHGMFLNIHLTSRPPFVCQNHRSISRTLVSQVLLGGRTHEHIFLVQKLAWLTLEQGPR